MSWDREKMECQQRFIFHSINRAHEEKFDMRKSPIVILFSLFATSDRWYVPDSLNVVNKAIYHLPENMENDRMIRTA